MNFHWNNQMLDPVLAILITTLTYLMYWYGGKSKWIMQHRNHILLQRYWGLCCMGIIPFLLFSCFAHSKLSEIGLSFFLSERTTIGLALFSILILILNFFNAKTEKNLAQYPQIRKNQWSKGLYLHNLISWLLYLLAYEFLFRALLLFILVKYTDVWLAISVNVALYALAHFPKGSKETLGALPFGLIMCLMALDSGSFWPAFLLHAVMAVSNSIYSIYFHPQIQLKK